MNKHLVLMVVFLIALSTPSPNGARCAQLPDHLIQGGTSSEDKKSLPPREKKSTSTGPSQVQQSTPRSDANNQSSRASVPNSLRDADSSLRDESRKLVGEVKGDGFRITFYPIVSSYGQQDFLRISFRIHNDSNSTLYCLLGAPWPKLIDHTGLSRDTPDQYSGIKVVPGDFNSIVKGGHFDNNATAISPGGSLPVLYSMRTPPFPRTGSLPDFNFTGNLIVSDGRRYTSVPFTSPVLPLYLSK